jgi:hypothetical protein
VSFPLIFYSAVIPLLLVLVLLLFVFNSSALIEGRRYTNIYISTLCHVEASRIYKGAPVAVECHRKKSQLRYASICLSLSAAELSSNRALQGLRRTYVDRRHDCKLDASTTIVADVIAAT